MRRERTAIGLPVAAMAWGLPAYAVLATGDFMAMGRFLVPGLPFQTLLLAWLLCDLGGTSRLRGAIAGGLGVLLAGIGALPGWDVHLVPQAVRERFRFRHNVLEFRSEYEQWKFQQDNARRWAELGRALRLYARQRLAMEPTRVSIVFLVIGALATTPTFSCTM